MASDAGWGYGDVGGSSTTDWSLGTANTLSGQDYELSDIYQAWVNEKQRRWFTTMWLGFNDVAGSYTYKEIATQLWLQYTNPAAKLTPYAPVANASTAINPVLSVSVTPGRECCPIHVQLLGLHAYGTRQPRRCGPRIGFTSTSPYVQVPINTLTAGNKVLLDGIDPR